MPTRRGEAPPGATPDPIAALVAPQTSIPPRGQPPEWQDGLYQRVIDAIFALPNLFKTSLNIAGIRATDLFTLNSALGASIEQSVVDNLNALRKLWDVDGRFQHYAFTRQAQVFPDVRLQTSAPGVNPQILMGIELKGWFALAKEGEPSFRYYVTPAACADADLLVVFPWVLNEVFSGAPKLLRPFVSEARSAAEQRNHYWNVLRDTRNSAPIKTAEHQAPYPRKGDKFNDSVPHGDSGKNFGRFARGGVMGEFISTLMQEPIAGIPLGAWQRFLKIFSESVTEATLRSQLMGIEARFGLLVDNTPEAKAAFSHFVESLGRLIAALEQHT